MEKLFVFPQYPTGKASNPYCDNFIESLKNYYIIISRPNYSLPLSLDLLFRSTAADIYVINWLENIGNLKGGCIQALIGIIALFIIRLRQKKIVWVFHNIHPHSGENIWSKIIMHILYKQSYLIISHSYEASEYARQYSHCPVLFKNHPLKRFNYGEFDGEIKNCDFFYWGTILPYKGVLEFLSNIQCHNSHKKIYILGKCQDKSLCEKIESFVDGDIVFDNRKADFCEIASRCRKSKYVIFPYIGESISSSGVLMDTLLMGGTPVGPNRGAFADLAAKGCCITYDNIDEVFELPTDETHRIRLDQNQVKIFIETNTWDAFGKCFFSYMQ